MVCHCMRISDNNICSKQTDISCIYDNTYKAHLTNQWHSREFLSIVPIYFIYQRSNLFPPLVCMPCDCCTFEQTKHTTFEACAISARWQKHMWKVMIGCISGLLCWHWQEYYINCRIVRLGVYYSLLKWFPVINEVWEQKYMYRNE